MTLQCAVPAGTALEPVATSSPATSTSAMEANMPGGLLLGTSRVLPNPPRTTSPTTFQSEIQNLASKAATDDGGDSFISLLSPSCGTTSGGEQIVLIVVNLPPSATLFARFGDSIVSTVRYKMLKASQRRLIIL